MLTNGRNGYSSLNTDNYYDEIQGVLAATLDGSKTNIDGIEFSSNGKYLVSSARGKLRKIIPLMSKIIRH
jgi:WD40 repeat protein